MARASHVSCIPPTPQKDHHQQQQQQQQQQQRSSAKEAQQWIMGMESTLGHVDDLGSSPSESCTEASEDSVEVRVRPVSLPSATYSSGSARRNKRKPAEPRRVTGGKRFRWDSDSDCSNSAAAVTEKGKHVDGEAESDVAESEVDEGPTFSSVSAEHSHLHHHHNRHHHHHHQSSHKTSERTTDRTNESPRLEPETSHFASPRVSRGGVSAVGECSGHSSHRNNSDEGGRSAGSSSGKQKQRNYKNMTRERRIEANARERTRVHTISAAFESLRRAVPAYSCNQKLSKLAILRIACSYILALASLNDGDYSHEQDGPSFAECVDLCTRTIQNEGRARRRRE